MKKLVRKQGGQLWRSRFISTASSSIIGLRVGATQENNTLHVMDNQSALRWFALGIRSMTTHASDEVSFGRSFGQQ